MNKLCKLFLPPPAAAAAARRSRRSFLDRSGKFVFEWAGIGKLPFDVAEEDVDDAVPLSRLEFDADLNFDVKSRLPRGCEFLEEEL